MNQPEITIFLSPKDAELFVQFQKHHEIFNLLLQEKVFDINYGKCVLNFANGELQTISKDEVVWKRSLSTG